MLGFVFMIIIIFVVVKRLNEGSSVAVTNKLNVALLRNEFTNIQKLLGNKHYTLIAADTHGENYLFAIKNDATQFNVSDIVSIYEIGQRAHIHNVVIIMSSNVPLVENVKAILKRYHMEVWNMEKLNQLAGNQRIVINPISTENKNELNVVTPTVTRSVLRTSDVSDDKCKIDPSSYDPIQDYNESENSVWKRIFSKPERL